MSLKEIADQNKKQIHFWFGDYPDGTFNSYSATEFAINYEKKIIHTTQILLCTTDLFKRGYKIFIHPILGDMFEIKLGDNSPYTDKEIRMRHNLYKMLVVGTFNTTETSVC